MTTPYRDKWQSDCGNVTLYLGDCLEILPTLGKVDCVVTDPPYGIAHKSHGQHFRGHEMINGDDDTGHAEAIREWAELREICCVMFFSPYRPLHGWRSVLAWIKGGHVGIGGDRETCWKRDFELIGVERNGPLSGNRDNAVLVGYNALSPPPSGHAHEKPVELVEYLLRKVGGDVICDPCCGSGTTGVACVRLGRKFIGMEIEPRYYQIAKRRIRDELAKSRILDPPERKPTQKRLVD